MSALPTHLFVLAVVADRGRYLVVEERDGTFYLPAGKVEPGEDLLTAVARETLEEAGVRIAVQGLLGFDHEPLPGRARMRFVFAAFAPTEACPKDFADRHSRGARWATPSEIAALPLRHREVCRWVALHAAGRPLLPRDAYEPGVRGGAFG
jgi:phosphatase NudJ